MSMTWPILRRALLAALTLTGMAFATSALGQQPPAQPQPAAQEPAQPQRGGGQRGAAPAGPAATPAKPFVPVAASTLAKNPEHRPKSLLWQTL